MSIEKITTCDGECPNCKDMSGPCAKCRREIHESWHAKGLWRIREEECHPDCPGVTVKSIHSPDAILNTMRDMLIESKPEEVSELTKEAGLDLQELANSGRDAAKRALDEYSQRMAKG